MNLPKKIYEYDELKKVIDFMKSEKNIIDIAENAGISTIFTDSLVLISAYWNTYLLAGQIIQIGNVNYSVLSVDLKLKTFTIAATGLYHMSTDPVPVKVLDFTKWNLAVNLKHGSRVEINEVLANAEKDESKNLIQYPFIWLFVNNKQEKNSWDNIDFKTQLEFSFVHLSSKEYLTDERTEKVFKPILEPLLELFLITLQSQYFAHIFHFETFDYQYDKWVRYFYGSSDKNAQVFDAATDAIEISLELNFKKQY